MAGGKRKVGKAEAPGSPQGKRQRTTTTPAQADPPPAPNPTPSPSSRKKRRKHTEPLAAVLFDLDDTLLHTGHLAVACTNAVLEKVRRGSGTVDYDEVMEGIRITNDDIANRLEWHLDRTLSSHTPQMMEEMYKRMLCHVATAENTPKVPGVLALVNHLREQNIRTAVLSNGNGEYVRQLLLLHGWTGAFEIQLGVDDVKEAKPSPKGLKQLCQLMKLKPRQCIYIGDSATDGQAAQSAGMASIGYQETVPAKKERDEDDSEDPDDEFEDLHDYMDEVASTMKEVKRLIDQRISETGKKEPEESSEEDSD